jgi:FkbM family methyltransferase
MLRSQKQWRKTMATLRRHIVGLLDRPGTRGILAALGTRYAKRVTGNDVSMFYDGIWLHRMGDKYLADSSAFSYYEHDIRAWADRYKGWQEEAADYWFYRYSPKAADVVIDVGAGIGTDVIAFSEKIGESGRILAIDAQPTTYLRLVKTCKWNGLKNVLCEQVAVTDKAGTVYIEDDAVNHESNAIGAGNIPVPGATLDELCERHKFDHVDFLKMNIEGAERMALPGMEKTIRNTARVAIACHDFRAERGDGDHFATREVVCEFLRRHGFELDVRFKDPRPYVRDHVHGWKSGSGAT